MFQGLSMRVWFNRHFALIYRVLRLIREADVHQRFTLICTHKQPHFVGFSAAHEHAREPEGLSSQDYVRWCLEFAIAQRVDVFQPSHEANAIVAARAQFEKHGIRVLSVADARTLPRLHHKAWVYHKMAGLVPLAAMTLIRDPRALPKAIENLESQGFQACIKPAVSIYGKGFYRLMPPQGGPSRRSITPQAWMDLHPGGRCASQLVLEYLPGHEFSVDCIGDAGSYVTGVVRKKSLTTPSQLLVCAPDLLAYAGRLIERFRLSGLVNIQFKEDQQGEPKLLEINPRAAGGVAMSCLSGINLPYLALCGTIDGFAGLRIPAPQLGLRVTEVGMPLVLSND